MTYEMKPYLLTITNLINLVRTKKRTMHLEEDLKENHVTVSDWIISLFISSIPLVGIIMLSVWAFGSNTIPSKANWAKASLIFYLIGFVLIAVFWSTFFGLYMAGQDYS